MKWMLSIVCGWLLVSGLAAANGLMTSDSGECYTLKKVSTPCSPAVAKKTKVHHSRAVKRSGGTGLRVMPLGSIQQFLNASLVVRPEALQAVPYIVGFGDDHLVGGTGFVAYVSGQLPTGVTKFSIYRPRPPYFRPGTQELLGVPAIYMGDADLKFVGTPSTFLLTQARENIEVGDRLFPAEHHKYPKNFVQRTPGIWVRATILSMFDGLTEVGAYQVVVLDHGQQEGLQPGDVLNVVIDGRVVPDPVTKAPVRLPGEQTGQVMVYRTFEKVSFALVTRARSPIQVGDKVLSHRVG
jgi:hypothetical protein